VRVLASVFALIALVSVSSGSAAPQQTCPRDAALGTVSFPRAGHKHVVSLASCADHVAGRASTGRPTLRSPDGRYVASVRATGRGKTAKQTIWVTDTATGQRRPVFSETEYYKVIGPGDTPGPIVLLRFSADDRWVFFTIDPGSSASIAADGLVLRVVSATGGS